MRYGHLRIHPGSRWPDRFRPKATQFTKKRAPRISTIMLNCTALRGLLRVSKIRPVLTSLRTGGSFLLSILLGKLVSVSPWPPLLVGAHHSFFPFAQQASGWKQFRLPIPTPQQFWAPLTFLPTTQNNLLLKYLASIPLAPTFFFSLCPLLIYLQSLLKLIFCESS